MDICTSQIFLNYNYQISTTNKIHHICCYQHIKTWNRQLFTPVFIVSLMIYIVLNFSCVMVSCVGVTSGCFFFFKNCRDHIKPAVSENVAFAWTSSSLAKCFRSTTLPTVFVRKGGDQKPLTLGRCMNFGKKAFDCRLDYQQIIKPKKEQVMFLYELNVLRNPN